MPVSLVIARNLPGNRSNRPRQQPASDPAFGELNNASAMRLPPIGIFARRSHDFHPGR
jgi:hypothetical protein